MLLQAEHQLGKNLVENKMPEAQLEARVHRARRSIVVITPGIQLNGLPRRLLIPLRPETDGANFLGG